jgi:hypothetical protein
MLVHYSRPEIRITQIDLPLAFLKQKDLILSEDRWNPLIGFKVTQHAAILAELQKT